MRKTLASALALSLTLTPLFASANASPAPQEPDNSQYAPQYPTQDYPQQPEGNPAPDNTQPQGSTAPDYSQPSPNSAGQNAAGFLNFTPDQLDNLLSPIALYPDPLLAQLFVASTFPDQVLDAAQYVRTNGTSGVDGQNWDVSVRSVAHYPTVIQMMADKIDWTTSLGQAYANQPNDVSATVQRLRHEARKAGNLESTPQQEVIENGDYIAVNPASPQYIYVPTYDPAVVYSGRPYWGPAISFGLGFPIGAWLNLGFHWGFGLFGGLFYTGWNPFGWGHGCWNCGWIGRSRGFVDFHNGAYVNNRFNHINVNRGVMNRSINANNLSHFNSIHRNVGFNNVRANNARINTAGGRFSAANRGFDGRNGARNDGRSFAANNAHNDRPPANAGLNHNLNNNRANDLRQRDNNAFNNRSGNTQQSRGFQQAARPGTQSRPSTQITSAQRNSAAQAFSHSQSSFNAHQSASRAQSARQQPQHQVRQARQSVPHQSSHGSSHGGGSHASHSSHGGGGGSHGGGGKKHK
jgi:uncharacterized membrane protein YgcG